MPAAAVIPAPIVYANNVAIKTLIVKGFRYSILCSLNEIQISRFILIYNLFCCNLFFDSYLSLFFFKKVIVFQTVVCYYYKIWNNK